MIKFPASILLNLVFLSGIETLSLATLASRFPSKSNEGNFNIINGYDDIDDVNSGIANISLNEKSERFSVSNNRNEPLRNGWRICPENQYTVRVETPTTKLETNPEIGIDNCISTTLPTTITAAEISANKYEDPFIDLNLENIPDISKVGRKAYTRWFIKDTLLSTFVPKRTFLIVKGINYHAEIFYYGKKVCEVLGMFRKKVCEVTDINQDLTGINPIEKLEKGKAPAIAILVHPPLYVGDNDTIGQGGDHQLARNGPTTQFTGGWDWIQHTPDRHTGIWDDIMIKEIRGKAVISGPMGENSEIVDDINVRSTVLEFNPENPVTGTSETGLVGVKLNFMIDFPPKESKYSTPRYDISILSPEGVKITTASNTTEFITNIRPHDLYSKSTLVKPGLLEVKWSTVIENARLWWPHTWGEQFLYKVKVKVWYDEFLKDDNAVLVAKHDELSDEKEITIGFRSVKFEVGDGEKKGVSGPVAYINNKKVFLTGGNWIVMDQFLRTDSNPSNKMNSIRLNYDHHVRSHKFLGFDLIRVWGGGIAERDGFYEACDREGLLVWQEFWMSGDNNGRWAGSYDWPDGLDGNLVEISTGVVAKPGATADLFIDNAKSSLRTLHTHPSLAFWCLGNEITGKEGGKYKMLDRLVDAVNEQYYGTENTDNGAITNDNDIEDFVKDLKSNKKTSGSVVLFHSSMGNYTDYNPFLQSTPKDGAYTTLSEKEYWTRNPGVFDWKNGELIRMDKLPITFNPEAGGSAIAGWRTLKTFLTKGMQDFPKDRKDVPGKVWNWHTYEGWVDDEGKHWVYDVLGGAPENGNLKENNNYVTNASEYSTYGNLAHYYQTKLLYESYLGHMFEWYSALFYWKSQSPWPVFRGFLYDWEMRNVGGGWGAKNVIGRNIRLSSDGFGNDLSGLHIMMDDRRNIIVSNRGVKDIKVDRLFCMVVINVPQVGNDGKKYSERKLCWENYYRSGVTIPAMSKLNVTADASLIDPMDAAMSPAPAADLIRFIINDQTVNEYLSAAYRKKLGKLRNDVTRPQLKGDIYTFSEISNSTTRTMISNLAKSNSNGPDRDAIVLVSTKAITNLNPSKHATIVTGVNIAAAYDASGKELLPLYCDRGYMNLIPGDDYGAENVNFICWIGAGKGESQISTMEVEGFNAYTGVLEKDNGNMDVEMIVA